MRGNDDARGRTASVVDDAGAKLERYVLSQFPDGVVTERGLVSGDEVIEGFH